MLPLLKRCDLDGALLVAVDTGVLRRVDREELAWLRAALDASRGKMVMAVLGHPLFAGGHDVSTGDENFMAVRSLLRSSEPVGKLRGQVHAPVYATITDFAGVEMWIDRGVDLHLVMHKNLVPAVERMAGPGRTTG